MLNIVKIKLHNFKRFGDLTVDINPNINIFIGDNESGKSTILQAIDIVARASRTRVENIGLDRLFNIEAICEFMNGDRNLRKIPEMYIELYLSNQPDPSLEGTNNSDGRLCSGIRLRCVPNDDYSQQIAQILQNKNASFPLEFYKIVFDTFSGEAFNAYTKKMNSICIDNSTIGTPRAMREYVNDIYHLHLNDIQRINAKHDYKDSKIQFQDNILAKYNALIQPYSFAIRESADDNIETDITLLENNIPLENKGTGTQCFIKTKLSMNRSIDHIDVVLIEEPENHLSYLKMLELIDLIRGAQNRQLFISTHSDLVATRLNLKNCILLNSSSNKIVSLGALSNDTADFFTKAPDNNMLQFVLSPKSILVEGDAEFILMEALFKRAITKELFSSGVGVISVDGKCFKRYLDIAKLLGNKVAVITDNDHDYANNITTNYSDYSTFNNISIYSDTDNTRYTFEVCMYKDNKDICDNEFQTARRELPIEEYMLKNKADAAFKLLKNRASEIIVPQYIKDAITWIDA